MPESVSEMVNGLSVEALPCLDHLVTEDDEPVDGMYSEKQMRLLTEPLYSSWPGPAEGRSFLATAYVGVFYSIHQSAIVPDVLLSVDVTRPPNLAEKRYQSYFVWEYGKPPDVAIEIVSNRRGEEDTRKLELYARIGVPYYIIWDPLEKLGSETLRAYGRSVEGYQRLQELWFPSLGLGLATWQGAFEGMEDTWLRWTGPDGMVIPTGAERSQMEYERAEQERRLAEQERGRAEQARLEKEELLRRLERLEQRIRAAGNNPQE